MYVKNSILVISLILFSSLSIFGQENENLPRWMTDEETHLMDSYLQSFDDRGITTPPPFTNLRTAAEWEEVQALVITWTGQYNSIQSQIVDASQEECLVIIHCTDSNDVKSILTGNGVPLVNISFIEIAYNSIWIRDYGANSVYVDDVDSLILVDWIYNRPRPLDDVIPDAYAGELGLDLYSTITPPNDIMATGGNFMADGSGLAFSSELITDENDGSGPYSLSYPNHSETELDNLFYEWMGIELYCKMTVLPYDDIHHIDMHMKIIDEETLLVGEYPDGVSDGPQIEANLQYVLDNYSTKWGTPFNVVRIPQPPSTSGDYPDGSWWGASYRTYANQTFVNNTILLPSYRTEYDTTAERILEEVLPGYNIVMIDVDNSGENLISSGGAIHCITHTIGVSDPLLISHKKLEDTNDDLNPYVAEAEIKHKSGVSAATLYYKTSLTGSYTAVSMSNTTGDIWSGQIPAQVFGTTVYYYIEGESSTGKTITHPMPAPAGFHKFRVIDPAIAASIAQNTPVEILDIYPNPASAITVIPVNSYSQDNCTITLTNLLGETVEIIYNGDIEIGQKNFFIDASNYAPGVYQVIIKMGEYQQVKKLVIN